MGIEKEHEQVGIAAALVVMAAALVGVIPVVIAGLLAHALLIACAWNWLLVPILGLHTLAIGQGFALAVVLTLTTGARDALYKRDLRDRAMLVYAIWYGLTLLLIYIAKHFV